MRLEWWTIYRITSSNETKCNSNFSMDGSDVARLQLRLAKNRVADRSNGGIFSTIFKPAHELILLNIKLIGT